MNYQQVKSALQRGEILVLDGGTGTELEKRGVPMDTNAWCGTAALAHVDTLEQIHRDYIAAGAEIITTNTYSSSRLMLEPAGQGEKFDEINQNAIDAAMRARADSDVLVAGSLSHRIPIARGAVQSDPALAPTVDELRGASNELGMFLANAGCDLILLEMMYHPQRMAPAFDAASATGKPVWAGFSARRGEDGSVLSITRDADVPFTETVKILRDYDIDAAGIMHTPSDLIDDALAILRSEFDGPLMAYPDSGYFVSPHWQFEAIIEPADLLAFARKWVESGVQIVGGCCGLSPEHIEAFRPLKS